LIKITGNIQILRFFI